MFAGEELNRSAEDISREATANAAGGDPISLAYLRTYHWIRTLVGILDLALPIILVTGVLILDRPDIGELHSLSAYYHTGMRDFFAVILSVTGILLFTYRISEKNWDNRLSWIAGAASIGVAFFPTRSSPNYDAAPTRIQEFFGEEPTNLIHLTCASVVVASMACICWLFAYREEKDGRNVEELGPLWWPTQRWARFHLFMAVIIILSALFIIATNLVNATNGFWWDKNGLLLGEVVVTAAFGSSWLAKGMHLSVLLNKKPRDLLRWSEIKASLDRFQADIRFRSAAGTFMSVVIALVVILWLGSPWLQSHMGGVRVLDAMIWPLRGPGDVSVALEAYGVSGRQWYLSYLVFDILFALLYARLLAHSVAFAINQFAFLNGNLGYVAMIVPFIGGLVFDLGENLLLGFQTDQFPHQSDLVSWIALLFTVGKVLAFASSLLLALSGLAYATWRSIRTPPETAAGNSTTPRHAE